MAKGPTPYKYERLTYDVHVMGSYAGKGVLSVVSLAATKEKGHASRRRVGE